MKKIFLVVMIMLMGMMFTGCNEPAEPVLEDEGVEEIIVENIEIEEIIIE